MPAAQAFPAVLFESCSGGGGRFDPALLYYMPQVWTSDNTDALARIKIQYGTSLAYPASASAWRVLHEAQTAPGASRGELTRGRAAGVARAPTHGGCSERARHQEPERAERPLHVADDARCVLVARDAARSLLAAS